MVNGRILPKHILKLIGEYSKPLSRPDWRTFERTITIEHLIYFLKTKYPPTLLYFMVSQNLFQSTFFIAYRFIRDWGIDKYVLQYGGNSQELLSNKSLSFQNSIYEIYKNEYHHKHDKQINNTWYNGN
jgi:hypothetical protein